MAEMIEPSILRISLPAGPDEGQPARAAAFQEASFQGDKECFGCAVAAVSRGRHNVPISNQRNRVLDGNDLAVPHVQAASPDRPQLLRYHLGGQPQRGASAVRTTKEAA